MNTVLLRIYGLRFYDSLEARWVSVEELKEIGKKLPFLRAPELLDWATYLDNGGVIYPLETFQGNQELFI